jgi:hypothetical protein
LCLSNTFSATEGFYSFLFNLSKSFSFLAFDFNSGSFLAFSLSDSFFTFTLNSFSLSCSGSSFSFFTNPLYTCSLFCRFDGSSSLGSLKTFLFFSCGHNFCSHSGFFTLCFLAS